MYTVTQRANSYKQPRGGFIGIWQYDQIQLESVDELSDMDLEIVPPIIMGMAVDYLTRLMLGEPIRVMGSDPSHFTL